VQAASLHNQPNKQTTNQTTKQTNKQPINQSTLTFRTFESMTVAFRIVAIRSAQVAVFAE
jgi:hypothetical protein